MPRVVIVGGTGRVGGAVAEALLRERPEVEVVLAGRNREVGEARAKELGDRASFAPVDLTQDATLHDALQAADAVVHTAGPFQHGRPVVLDAAIDARVPYADVCDDIGHARRAKDRDTAARASGVPAITTGGVFPGVSNVMVAELAERGGGAQEVEMSYFVAGSGGAGPTVLTTTFLIAAEPVITYQDHVVRPERAFTGRKVVDFAGLGARAVYFFELPEVSSLHDSLGIPTVRARFGTAPDMWNLMTRAMVARPFRRFSTDPQTARRLVDRIGWTVRLVDRWVGSALSMHFEVKGADGSTRTGDYTHTDTVDATGTGVAHFAVALLEGSVAPGVWFPEEAIGDRGAFLKRAAEGTDAFHLDP